MYVLVYRLLHVVAVALICAGCSAIGQTPSMHAPLTECPPPPEPECHPIQWSSQPLDTSRVPPHRDTLYYWTIRQVRGANTQQNEYALCLTAPTQGLLTLGSPAQQHVAVCQRVQVDSLAVDTLVDLPDMWRSFGAVSHAKGLTLATIMPHGCRLTRVVALRGTVTQLSNVPPVPLPFDTTTWIGHPALSSDGSFLIVASLQSGGHGGVDLWYSTRRKDGSWDSLRNLGGAINTPCDELSPFVTSDGMLLFSSNGHATVGGYDLFAANLRHTEHGLFPATTPENLSPPINTEADELFPSVPPGAKYQDILYWSSNRREGNFDLYVAQRHERPKAPPPAVVVSEQESVPKARLRGRVRTQRNEPVVDADINVREVTRRRTIAQTQTDTSGSFEVTVPTNRELEITAQSGTGFYDVRRMTIPASDTTALITEDFVIPDVLTLRINFPHDQSRVPYEFVLDSNGIQTPTRWTEELDRVAANILRYRDRIKRIVLVGHTDPNGTHEYNLALGKRRVEFVIEELVKRGVPAQLLEGRTAGETQLLPRRIDETQEQYYRRNRRVELSKVLQ